LPGTTSFERNSEWATLIYVGKTTDACPLKDKNHWVWAAGWDDMMWRTFFSVVTTVFLAEMGDKTQLATMLFAADVNTSKWVVFWASSTALILAAGIGVLAGAQLQRFIQPSTLKMLAGCGFILIGIWTLLTR
jgi:putative Ca2+/H+ antiporter (TMEM165/GDT1 family)